MESLENLVHNSHALLNRRGYSLGHEFSYVTGNAYLHVKGSHMVLVNDLQNNKSFELYFLGDGLQDKFVRFTDFNNFDAYLYAYNNIKPFMSNIEGFTIFVKELIIGKLSRI